MPFPSSQLHGVAGGCAHGGRGCGGKCGRCGFSRAAPPPQPVNQDLSPGKAGVRPEQGALESRLPLTFPEWEVCSLGGPAIFHVHYPQDGFLGGRQGCGGSRLWVTCCAWQGVGRDRHPTLPSPEATHLMPSLGKAPSLRHLSAAIWRGRGGEEAQPELQAQRRPNTTVFSVPWPGAAPSMSPTSETVAVTGLFLLRRKGEHREVKPLVGVAPQSLPSNPAPGTPAPARPARRDSCPTVALSQLS